MKDITFPRDRADWDAYDAFHTFCGMSESEFSRGNRWAGPSPLVMFDTGEVICTTAEPNPNQRATYHSIGVQLTTTKSIGGLYMPDGTITAGAWLDDGGMQYLLHDFATKRVVRLDGMHRYGPSTDYYGKPRQGSPITAGIPHRFQYRCRAYIPGPGLPPLSHEKIKVSIPFQKAGYTSDELEHIKMIVTTGQAAMKLTDHEALSRSVKAGGISPDTLLKCTTWQDVPDALLTSLVHYGAGRVVRAYDYLLTEKP